MKNIKKMLMTFIIITLLIMTKTLKTVSAEGSWQTKSFESKEIGYGVTLDVYRGTSKSSYYKSTADDRGQTIYTINIPNSSKARIVQWGRTGSFASNYWGSYTLRDIAQDYEKKHPGMKVIAATNNWLSDTLSNNIGELDAVQAFGGLNMRVSDKQGTTDKPVFNHGYINRPNFLGFDITGKKAYFTDNYNADNYTDYLNLSYYEGVDKPLISLDYHITKINEEPNDGEIAIYFSNHAVKTQFSDAVIYKMDGELLRYDKADRTKTFVERDAFAMGKFVSIVDEIDTTNSLPDNYYFVSKNKDFNNLNLEGKTVVAQYEFKDELKNAYSATTYYYRIVRDGEVYPGSFGNWDEINCEVHPRTAFIIKEDGSFAMSVIDGRKPTLDRTGMDYEEMAYFYKTMYNGYNVFNYDGGGSSSIAVINEYGFLNIVNNPSDGKERRVANANLVVVEKEDYEIEQTDLGPNTIELSLKEGIDLTKYEEITATITKTLDDGTETTETKKFTNGKVTFEGLVKETTYRVSYAHILKGTTEIVKTKIGSAKTCKNFAELFSCRIRGIKQDQATFNIVITDKEGVFNKGTIEVNGETYEFVLEEAEVLITGLTHKTDYEAVIKVYSGTQTAKVKYLEYRYNFKTGEAIFPEKINLRVDKENLKVNDRVKLKVEYEPIGTVTSLTYESSDEDTVEVSETGMLYLKQEGTATITVTTAEGITSSIVINVEANTAKTPSNGGCAFGISVGYFLLTILLSTAILLKREK